MKRARKVLRIVAVSLALVYLGDYLSVRFGHRDPLTSVPIEVYYAIRLKGQKTEFTRADPEAETCVHSLFPQMGYLPCWYVTRHTQKWVEIGMRHGAGPAVGPAAEPPGPRSIVVRASLQAAPR